MTGWGGHSHLGHHILVVDNDTVQQLPQSIDVFSPSSQSFMPCGKATRRWGRGLWGQEWESELQGPWQLPIKTSAQSRGRSGVGRTQCGLRICLDVCWPLCGHSVISSSCLSCRRTLAPYLGRPGPQREIGVQPEDPKGKPAKPLATSISV